MQLTPITRLLVAAFVGTLSVTLLDSCKKDKLDSRYRGLLQQRWTLKSTSRRLTSGNNQGTWSTKQIAEGSIREYKSDGTLSYEYPLGTVFYKGNYELMSDSIILEMHPATINTPYSPPDTMFIRYIDNNLFIAYRRRIFISGAYSSKDEIIDSLYR